MKQFLASVLLSLTVAAAERAPVSVPPAFDLGLGTFMAAGPYGEDFDRDGHRDFLMIRQEALAVHRGRGDGTFAPAVLTAAGLFALTAEVADLDLDGIPDVAVRAASEPSGNHVVVFRGRGDGTFDRTQTIECNVWVRTFALGDFTGDGAPDLVLPDFTSTPSEHILSVYPNGGNGLFGTPVRTPTGVAQRPWAPLSVADFDGDGRLDAVAGGGSTSAVSYGTGDGHFGRTVEAGAGATSLAVADFNSDGRPDWVATQDQYVARSPRLVLNQADGTFVVTDMEGLPRVRKAIASDLTGDGVDDVVLTADARHLITMVSRGDGTFDQPRFFSTPIYGAVDAGRYDEGGTPDVLIAGAQAVLARGRGDGLLDLQRSWPTGAVPVPESSYDGDPLFPFQLADATGDGHPDVIAAVPDESRFFHLVVLPNDGTGRFGAAVRTPTPVQNYPPWLLAEDFDGDGRIDVAIGSSEMWLYTGRGDGTFAEPMVTPDVGWCNEAHDVTGDGKPDLLYIERYSINVYPNTGGGTFGSRSSTSTRALGGDYAIVDIDRNGSPDVVFGSETVFLNQGGGRFVASVAPGAPSESVVAAGDFDEDGQSDLVTQEVSPYYNVHPPGLHIYRGTGTAAFSPSTVIGFDRRLAAGSGDSTPGSIAADVDGDGHLDLLSRGSLLLRGDGRGGFRAGHVLPYDLPYADRSSFAVADLDGNGSLDVVFAESATGLVDVLLTFTADSLDVPVTIDFTGPAQGVRHGQPVSFHARVGHTSPWVPRGLVMLEDRGRTIAMAHLDEEGKAEFPAALPVGDAEIAVRFSGDGVFASRTSASIHYSVARARMRASISMLRTVVAGDRFSIDATWRPEDGNVLAPPTGEVTIKGIARSETVPVRDRSFFTEVAPAQFGRYVITADYPGDANFEPFHIQREMLVVPPPTTVVLVVHPNRSVPAGGAVTLTAIVAAPAAGGSVTFFDRKLVLGTAPLKDGIATFTTTALRAGRLLIHATYSGGPVASGATSTGVYLSVEGPAPPPPRKRRSTR